MIKRSRAGSKSSNALDRASGLVAEHGDEVLDLRARLAAGHDFSEGRGPVNFRVEPNLRPWSSF
jgi:hypothetical protein